MTSEEASGVDPYDRLGTALRALSDAVVRSGVGAGPATVAAVQVEELVERLRVAGSRPRVHDSPYHAMSLVGGTAHPMAPQLHTTRTGDGVSGTVTLGASYEGGPGLVHGGVLSLLFDHAMGQALFVAGAAAMTVSLEVRYRAPTPLDVPLTITASVEGREGRKLFVAGRLRVDGRVTAEARGVFVQLTADNVSRIFPSDRVPAGPPSTPPGAP